MRIFALSLAVGCSAPEGPAGRADEVPPPVLSTPDTGPTNDTATGATGATADTGAQPPLDGRDRLIAGYLAHLQLDPTRAQSNGLRGADLSSVCDLWDALDLSSQGTFLTITARLAGSILAVDGSSMLDHVTTAYRVAGGEGATGVDPGSCGGAEYNRLVVSIDDVLHDALVVANLNDGGPGASGGPDLADIPIGGVWRASEDLAGPHEPFTLSLETEDGAPRGQVHFFADPGAPVANAPLGRLDLEDLVDPYALEMDQDYDCVHNSNPGCEYTFYGPLCLPEPTELGFTIYTQNYGSADPCWRPTGC
jgi:hypothetical protein